MHPSQMNDDVLNRAIAEIIAEGKGWTVEGKGQAVDRYGYSGGWAPPSYYHGEAWIMHVPNYTGDIAAAFGLPLETNDEKRRFAVELAKIVILDVNIGTAGIVYEAAFATARQRSEAWYSARRNE